MSEDAKFNRFLANWIINDFTGLCKKHKTTVPTCGIQPSTTLMLCALVYEKHLTKKEARKMMEDYLENFISSPRTKPASDVAYPGDAHEGRPGASQPCPASACPTECPSAVPG